MSPKQTFLAHRRREREEQRAKLLALFEAGQTIADWSTEIPLESKPVPDIWNAFNEAMKRIYDVPRGTK